MQSGDTAMWFSVSPCRRSRKVLMPFKSTRNLPPGWASMNLSAPAPRAEVMALGTSSPVSKQQREMPGPMAARMSSLRQP